MRRSNEHQNSLHSVYHIGRYPDFRRTPGPGIRGDLIGSLLLVSRQIIGEMNPGKPVLNPGMIAGRYCCGLVEAANSDIDFVGIRFGHESEWRAAQRTERTETTSPFQFSRLSGGEAKTAPTERCPGHKRSAAAATAVQTMAVCDIVGLAGGFVAYRAAQTAAADNVRVHSRTIDGRIRASLQWCDSYTIVTFLSLLQPGSALMMSLCGRRYWWSRMIPI